jgi:hypothetical protein
MAFLLRVVTKPKWVTRPWIIGGEIPADALHDLRSTDNKLSVWSVESNCSNLQIALAALAANRKGLDKLDYTLIDEGILATIPIKYSRTNGGTPHMVANATMHCDLIDLTVSKVANLAHQMMPLERVRVPERNVKLLLADALTKGELDRELIDQKLLNELELGDILKSG